MRGLLRYALVCEGIQLLRAIDLNMGDEGEGIGEVEVFALRRGVLFCHCVCETTMSDCCFDVGLKFTVTRVALFHEDVRTDKTIV